MSRHIWPLVIWYAWVIALLSALILLSRAGELGTALERNALPRVILKKAHGAHAMVCECPNSHTGSQPNPKGVGGFSMRGIGLACRGNA
jgi:hypothetical protein